MMAWELREKKRVFTAILNVETVTFAWSCHFRRMVIPGPDPVGVTGLPFDHARNHAVAEFLGSGCEYLFFLDSDVCAPPDCVPRLLKHNKPLISGLYCRRSPPHGVPVMMRGHQWVTDLPGPGEDPVVEAELVGTGCLLIHRSVFHALKPQRERPGKRWFDWRVDLRGMVPDGEATSEDYTFCLRVKRELGVPVLVDTSVRCRHVGYGEADYGQFAPLGSLPGFPPAAEVA